MRIALLIAMVVAWGWGGASVALAEGEWPALLRRERLMGEWLVEGPGRHGFDWSVGYTADVWGNTSGGQRRGAVYTGLMELGAEIDLGEAVGWRGARVGTSWLWLSGQDVSAEDVGNFLTVSNIAGFQTFRMFELWWEQEVGDWALKAGQISVDADFALTEYGAVFLNSAFGWPTFLSGNLPGGGVAYPVGGLGARLAWNPVEWFTFLSAVTQGSVLDQNVNRHGFRWDWDGGLTFLNEVQVRWSLGGEGGLPGQARGGGWLQTGRDADVLAASTASGNGGGYVILEQMVHRGHGEVGLYGRAGFAPPDRNASGLGFDGGVNWKGFLPGRDDDIAGVGFAYAGLTGGAIDELRGEGVEAAGAEMVVEATYQAVVTPWLSVQPDVQYVIQPGADRGLGNALVVGCRVSVVF